jgi:outer membrane protein OmpA-like peptidoglycan-associated protein
MIDNKTSNADGLAFLNGKIINTNGNLIPEGSYISLKCIDCDDNNDEVIMPRVRDGAFVSLLEKCKEYEITYYYEEGSKDPYTESFNTNCDIAFEEVNKTVLLVEEDKIIIPIFTYDLAGIVSDRTSNETITGATVEIFNKAGDTVELWNTDENGGFKSNLADGLVLNNKLDYNVKVKSIGYITQEFELNNVLGKDSIITVSYLIEKDTIETDLAKVLNLKAIYFDFDKSNIRDDARVELNKVIAALNNNPKIKVECGAHTDCRGPKGYNKGLSQRRAKSTAKYIKKKISNPERVTFKGYGESQPASDCSCKKCSTEQHQLNRRTEFIIKD